MHALTRFVFFMKACPCGKGEALGPAVVAIEARPLDPKPFERTEALTPTTPAARAVVRKGADEEDKSERKTKPVPDVVQHSGVTTRVVMTTKNPPCGRVTRKLAGARSANPHSFRHNYSAISMTNISCRYAV